MLKAYGIRPVKRLSQSFLIDEVILGKILDSLDVKVSETVLEIGAGIGAVTIPLLDRGCRVVAVEVDKRLVKALLREAPKEGLGGLDVIVADILALPPFKVNKIFSNTPFHISSDLTFKLLKEYEFEYAVLSYQREYALRLLAKPGSPNYGRLTVMVTLYGKVEPLFTIPKRSFYPPPKVDSMVVRLSKEVKIGDTDPVLLEWLVRSLFSQRRKKVAKVLKFSLAKIGKADLALRAVNELDVADKRVYELPPSTFLELARYLGERGVKPPPSIPKFKG